MSFLFEWTAARGVRWRVMNTGWSLGTFFVINRRLTRVGKRVVVVKDSEGGGGGGPSIFNPLKIACGGGKEGENIACENFKSTRVLCFHYL